MEPLHPGDPARIGPFTLVARLGAGGMGQVYLGRDEHGRQAAIKVVHPGLASDPGFRNRFAREIATAQRVHSAWTAAVLTADPQARPPWLASEYIAGPSLDQVVGTRGPLSEAATTILASRLAHALAHLHAADVVHRDLKPSNVLLAPDGPRLIDFGIARAADATKITATGAVVGTPAFMSPEQAAGDDADAPSDVFSLAAVLTYAATGAGPFGRTTNPMAMLLRIADDEPDTSGLPEALRPHLEPCFAKDPAARPTSAALAAALDPLGRAAADAAGLSAPDATLVDRGWPATAPATLAGTLVAEPRAERGRHPLVLPLSVLTGLVAVAVVLALVLVTGGGGAPEANAAEQPATVVPPVAYPERAQPAGTGSQLGRVPVGNGPEEVVVSPDGSRAYAVNYQDVTVVDPVSGAATATIGLSGAVGAAFTPDGSRAYIPILSGFLSVVDTATSTQIAAVPIAESPQSVTITPDGKAVYVVHGERSGANSLSVIDTASNSVTATVQVNPPDPARQFGHQMFVAAAPDSATLWVGGTTDTVSVVDTATRTVVATFDVDRPDSVSFGGGRAYVLGRTTGVTVFDVAARAKLGEIRQEGLVNAIAAAPDGRFLYMAAGATGQSPVVRVLDTATTFVVHEIAIDANPARIAVAPDGRTLFLSATEDDALVVVDTTPYA